MYLNTIFITNGLGNLPSDVSFPDYPAPIMGDVIFHNIQLLNHFFGRGSKWG